MGSVAGLGRLVFSTTLCESDGGEHHDDGLQGSLEIHYSGAWPDY
jgi:hypothetical protein